MAEAKTEQSAETRLDQAQEQNVQSSASAIQEVKGLTVEQQHELARCVNADRLLGRLGNRNTK